MSHNTLISNVRITSLDALQSAINELSKEGVNIGMNTTGRFRTWPGQPDKCDATITLPGEQFDIGLVKQPDGAFLPVFDHMLDNNRVVSCPVTPGERRTDRHTIGKLMQRYSVCLAEQEAARQGHMITRREGEDGEILLEVEV